MTYGEPTSLFLGMFPMTVGVQVTAGFHFLFCVCCIALTSSELSIWIGKFEVRPALQIVISSWSLLGIVATVGALVACSNRQSLALQVYTYYLLATDIIWAYVAVKLLLTGTQCSLIEQDLESQRLGISLSCGVVSACWFFCFLAVWAVCLFGAYTVWQLKDHLVSQEEAKHLLQYEDPTIKSFRDGTHLGFSETAWAEHEAPHDAQQADELANDDLMNWAAPRRGSQPAWGSLRPKSTGAESVYPSM